MNQVPAAAFAWSPDSNRIAATKIDNSGVVSIWDLASGKELTHFQVVDMSNGALPVGPIAWSPDGKHLLVVSTDIAEWDIASPTYQLHYSGHPFSYKTFPHAALWSHNGHLNAKLSPDLKEDLKNAQKNETYKSMNYAYNGKAIQHTL